MNIGPIVRVLKETNGVVAGPKGAAQQRLGLKRTTLLSRSWIKLAGN